VALTEQMSESRKIDVTRVAKCGISLASFVILAASKVVRVLAGARPRPRGKCMVLYYHSVPREQRGQFARQLDVILRHCKVIDATKAHDLPSGSEYAAITFDDAFENYVEEALPELKKRKMPSTMFVISDALGKGFGPVGRAEKVMSVDQLRALPEDLVNIGSHTVSHPFMPEIGSEMARSELVNSKLVLEGILGREIATFSFPFGGFSSELVEVCREAGYRRVFTTLPEFCTCGPGDFTVGRIRVDPTDWPIEFRLKLAGAYNWLPIAFALKRKLRKALGSDTAAAGKRAEPDRKRSMIREWSGN
jgi:peptidoglycan/xylan/chitin deacetylase (PgdA/CDA1 family)